MGPSAPAGGPSGRPNKKRRVETTSGNARSDTFNPKRAQVHLARSIPAQPADAALKDGELDLQAFVAAHEFEIRALEQSMATSKAVGSTRAFQKVPRGLRRRTASHNPKRVPQRLRARAKKEMAEDNTPMVEARRRKPRTTRARIRAETAQRLGILVARKRKKKAQKATDGDEGAEKHSKELAVVGRAARPKIRRNQLNDPPILGSRYRKRQINKTWLPTHPWQAKRARMTEPKNPLWRFAMPLTPNEKIYRPTHRAQGHKGALVWDMSYMSTIGLYGNVAGIERVLKRVGVLEETCWSAKGTKWRMGGRSWSGSLSRQKNGTTRLIGPATILWNPEPASTSINKEPKKTHRQVFIRIHPSAFLELFNELLRLTKMENPRLYIEDLRFEIGSIELTGPASTETLLSVLKPYFKQEKNKQAHAQLFTSLAGLTNPASLPSGAVLAFSVQDPRLSYPPRRLEVPCGSKAQMELLEKIANWPVEEGLQPYAIFDRIARHKASCLPSQSSLNKRRTESESGVPLKITASDPPIPITLVASRAGCTTQGQGTWTLLAPWKCILPFWYTIVHCPLISGGNPRFAGLNEVRQVAFERDMPWFPADFPATDAGVQWELEERVTRMRAWEKRPKSKRVEWTSLDLGAGRRGEVGDGNACDFEFLFNISQPLEIASSETQDSSAMDVDEGEGASVSVTKDSESSLRQLTHITKSSFHALLSSSTHSEPPHPPPNSVTTVRISLISRGVVTTCARIYRLPTTPIPIPTSSEAEVPATIPPSDDPSGAWGLPHDLRSQWLARSSKASETKRKQPRADDIEARKQLLAQELLSPAPSLEYPLPPPNQYDIGGHPLVPNSEDLIGFVTTGAFSLSEGRGVAIGSLAVERVLPGVRESLKEGRLCIVRNAGENVGWIARWEVI